MKKFLSFFCGRGAVWLYLSILAMAVCPTMVSVLAALIKGALLGETEVFFTKMAGSLIGWLFLCLAFGRALNEEYTHKTALRLLPRQLLNGILPMLVIYTAMQWVVSRTEGEMPTDAFVLLSAVESFLFMLALGRLAIASHGDAEVNLFPKGSSVLLWVRHPLVFLAVYVSYGVSKPLGVLFDYLFSGSSFFASLPRQFLLCLAAATLQWLILLPAYRFAMKRCFENPRKKRRKKQKDKAEHVEVTAAQGVPVLDEEKLPEPKHRLFVPALAASACSLVLFGIFIAGNLYNINNNPNGTDGKYRPYAAISSIDAYLEAGDDAFSRNDYITASLYYDYARTLTAAWQGYLTDGEGLKEALAANTGDTQILILSALATDEPAAQLKRLMNEGVESDYLLEALLSVENASEKRTALHRLISYGIVQKRMVLPTELDEEERKELEDAVSIAVRMLDRRKIVESYYWLFREDNKSSKALNIASELADQYPDDFYIQAMTTEIMWILGEAGNTALDRDTLERFSGMIRDNTKEDETEKILSFKAFFTQIYMNAGDEKGALAFLEDFFPDVSAKEIESLHISLLHGEGKYDEALKEAQEFAEKYPDDIDNLGYLAVGMLPRDPDIAIDSALKLADIIKNSEDPEQISAADSAIGTFLEYIFSYYTAPNPQFCGFQYFYSKVFTDEQRQKLLDDPVIYDYLLLWQDGGGDLGSNPGSAIVQANKMLEQHPDLPYVLYIRGFNKVQGKLFEDAIPDLERSIELDPSNPFVRIELAVAYNGVGRYADALRVTEEMDNMLDDMGYHPSAGYVGFSYYINEFLYEVKQNMYETADGTAESAE